MNFTSIAVFLVLVQSAGLTTAASKYCLQNSFSEYGNTQTCFENLTLDTAQFRQVCEPAQMEEVSFTTEYLEACPPQFKAVCTDLRTQSGEAMPYRAYLYLNDMAFMKTSCENNDGTWLEQ